jgi:GTP-binding protein EngB required for normal cell division
VTTQPARRSRPAGRPGAGQPLPADLARRLEALHALLDLTTGRLPESELAAPRSLLSRAAERLSLAEDYTVVALAGPTGCGKSSLFNSIVGFDVSAVGIRRPTTTGAVACVWDPARVLPMAGPREGLTPQASALLDWLGVPVGQRFARASALESQPDQALGGLVLLDLPDFDSALLGHHTEAEHLVRRADVVVWVTGPQKYADQVLHERYLRHAAHLRDSNIVVLNQIDQLESAAAVECVADLTARLHEDGLDGVPLIATSAATGAGMVRLREALLERLALPNHAAARISAELDQVAASLAVAFADGGPHPRRATDIAPAVAAADRAELVEGLAAAVGSPAVAAAGRTAHLARSRLATGWPLGRWISEALPRRSVLGGPPSPYRPQVPLPSPALGPQVHAAVRTATETVAGHLPGPWAAAVRKAGEQAAQATPPALDAAVSGADLGLARTPSWWAGVRTLQWALLAMFLAGVIEFAVFGLASSLTMPRLFGAPAPLVLLAAGVLGGPLTAAVSQGASMLEGGRRAARATARLRDRAARVGDECVIRPIEAELRAYQDAADQFAKLRSS